MSHRKARHKFYRLALIRVLGSHSIQMWCEVSSHTMQLARCHFPERDSCHDGITLHQAMSWNKSFLHDIASCLWFSHSNKKLAHTLGTGGTNCQNLPLTWPWRNVYRVCVFCQALTRFVPWFYFCCCDKTIPTESNLWGERVYLSAQFQVTITESRCCRDLNNQS